MGRKLGSLFGFLLFGFLIFLGFYHFSQRFASQYSAHNLLRKTDRPDTFYNEILPSDAARGKYVLRLNLRQSVGKTQLVYRGLEGQKTCLVDVIIPELDPDRPYKHRLDIEMAKRGFRMAGHNFRLVAVGENYLQLHFTLQ